MVKSEMSDDDNFRKIGKLEKNYSIFYKCKKMKKW